MPDSLKKAQAIRLSEEQFRRALEEAPIPTIMQAEDGQVLQLSRSWTELTGYKLSDMQTFDNWVTNAVYDCAENVRNHMHELFKGSKKSISVEFTVRTHNREMRNWSFSASSPGRLIDGRRFIIGMAVDITERKKAEQALKESESKYRLIVDTAEEGIWVATPEGRATFVNQKMADLLGYPPEDILGKEGLEFLEKPQATEVARNRKILKEKGKIQAECKFIKKDGSTLWTIANTAAVFDKQGNHVSNISMHTNITKRKKAEEALKNSEQAAVKYANELQALQGKLEVKTAETEQYATKMESLAKERAKQLQDAERLAAIGATAGMVGHDIRNPLQAITGEIYLVNCSLSELSDSRQKAEMKESMDSITANVSYINKIVADLQDYARTLKPEYTIFDLTKLIGETLRTIVFPDNIKLSIDEKGAPAIKSDQTYLRRSITNLVNNAIQAMPDGGTVTLKCQAKGDKILVSISDTGVGIPEHVKARLFTPMMTTKAKGQGLGLAVVKRLIEALNGSITFESQEGKGTEFTIELLINTSA